MFFNEEYDHGEIDVHGRRVSGSLPGSPGSYLELEGGYD